MREISERGEARLTRPLCRVRLEGKALRPTLLELVKPPPPPPRTATLRRGHILIVDDEELYRRALERVLAHAGYEISGAADATDAMAQVAAARFDLVLCDIRMPGISGLELVRQIHDLQPDLPCIIVTGYGGTEQSIEALRAGAYWYLEKPFDQVHLDLVRRLVEQAIEYGRLRAENRILQGQLRSRYRFESIIGQSAALRAVLEMVEKVADSDSTVLITGESGTGKELIAKAIHYNSSRSERMLVTVNCGAIPEELLESELFGHVRGAFTNAVQHREGRFSAADGGTIFLDEIGDMSPTLQVKLLRVLQDGSFEPVGSSKSLQVDVRVIAATNQNLERAIEDGRFRADLFYRLNVIPIEMPPLRARRDDIPLLISAFLDRFNQEKERHVEGFSDEALACLCTHAWRGNVRELENMVERLVVLRGDGLIEVQHLPENLRRGDLSAAVELPPIGPTGIDFNRTVDRIETHMILQALEQTGWNKNRAAQLLGLNRTTLLEKIKKKDIRPPASAD